MNFNKIVDRRGTFCTQWDYVADRFGKENLLPFTISDTDFEIPEAVQFALQERLAHPIFGYTRWDHPEFKAAIKSWFNNIHHTPIAEESIVYTPSVMYGVAALIDLISKPGDGVIIQTPAYDAFFKTINTSGRKLIENQLLYHNYHYEIDFIHLESLLAEERNTILLLCSPHNPTGRVWTKQELTTLVNLCKKYQVALISDEIHMDLVHSNATHLPVTQFDYNEIYLISSGTKTFNFPGLVFSYMVIPNSGIRKKYLTMLKSQHGLSSPSILGLTATMAAYTQGNEWVQELNDYLAENIAFATNFLNEQLPHIKVCQAEATYLMWLDISESGFTQSELQQKMIDIGKVAIMDGSIYGGNGKKFIRLNVGCPQEKLREGLIRLKKSVQ